LYLFRFRRFVFKTVQRLALLPNYRPFVLCVSVLFIFLARAPDSSQDLCRASYWNLWFAQLACIYFPLPGPVIVVLVYMVIDVVMANETVPVCTKKRPVLVLNIKLNIL
jgi:hypothetical protein